MGTIGDDLRLREVLDKAQRRTKLPSVSEIPQKIALSSIESLRQGTTPARGTLALAVGREELLNSMKQDLQEVANGGSCLRIINGILGMGKTFTLRFLQEYALREGFAASFLTLSPRDCPMDDLRAVYCSIVKGIRVSECMDKPALEHILKEWAQQVKEARNGNRYALDPWRFRELNRCFKTVLTKYYDSTHSFRPREADLALRWLYAEATITDARRINIDTNISTENALVMLGSLTKMIRYIRVKGLVVLLDETSTISSLTNSTQREAAYDNLIRLANTASQTPFSFFLYATTPDFISSLQVGFGQITKNVTTLQQLANKELAELAEEIRDLHFSAYGWQRFDINKSALRSFVRRCMSISIGTPRDFIKALIASLDTCQDNEEMTLEQVSSLLVK